MGLGQNGLGNDVKRHGQVRVVIADDQNSVRSAMRLRLEQEPEFELVAEAADATGLLASLAKQPADVLLLDWELPGLAIDHLLRLLRFEHPQLVIVAMSAIPAKRASSQQAGVGGFICKCDPPEAVLDELRRLYPVNSQSKAH